MATYNEDGEELSEIDNPEATLEGRPVPAKASSTSSREVADGAKKKGEHPKRRAGKMPPRAAVALPQISMPPAAVFETPVRDTIAAPPPAVTSSGEDFDFAGAAPIAPRTNGSARTKESRDAIALWPRVLAGARAAGYSADLLKIDVDRIGVGVNEFSREPQRMMPIDGAAVAGSELVSPADELFNYIVECIHRYYPSAARYTLYFRLKSGGECAKGELSLDKYEALAAQRRQVEELAHRRAQTARAYDAPASYDPRVDRQQYSSPPMQRPYAPGVPVYAPAPPGSDPETMAMRLELARMTAMIEERERARLAGEALPPLSVAPPPPPPPAAPTPAGDPLEDLFRQIEKFEKLRARLGLGAPQTPPAVAPVAVAAEPPSRRAVAEVDPLAGLAQVMQTFKQVEKMKGDLGKMFGIDLSPAEEEEKPAKVEPTAIVAEEKVDPFKIFDIPLGAGKIFKVVQRTAKSDASVADWAQAFAGANPEFCLKTLEVAIRVLDRTAVGNLIRKMTAQGGAPAQAAQMAVERGMVNGFGHAPGEIAAVSSPAGWRPQA